MENSIAQPLFTCLSCLIAFQSGEEQRAHYRSDHHRYNMKRRVASLPPVSAQIFNQKVLDKRLETAITTGDKGAICDACKKSYTTENAYRSHLQSKKHRENEMKAKSNTPLETSEEIVPDEVPSALEASAASTSDLPPFTTRNGEEIEQQHDSEAEEGNDEPGQTIEERLAAARNRMGLTSCLFCSAPKSTSFEDNLEHMARTHGFFIPDAEYLVDLPGLITYLGEKVAIGNVCLYCNGKGREFRSIHAVRKHMIDKSHCKLAYDMDKDRLEISDFYDFSSSYPIGSIKSRSKRLKKNPISHSTPLPSAPTQPESVTVDDDLDQWEDEDEENVTIQDGESVYDEVSASDEGELELPDDQITYGDSPFELVLPSGARIGHRSMVRYYKQSFVSPLVSRYASDPEGNSGAALVRKLIADKNSALIPVKGGFGAFGMGTMTIKARNKGEAREAGRHIREYRDQRRREEFKTAVGYRANHQKHYRDPLLQ